MTTSARTLAGSFLDAVAARDFDKLEALLAPQLAFRALLPSRALTHETPDEVAASFRRWFGEPPTFRIVDSSIGQVGARTYLRYRIAVTRAVGSDSEDLEIEQHLFLVGDERITSLDLMCSGFQRY